MARFTRRSILTLGVPLLVGACEPAGEVRVQELPPLTRPSAELRAGLPEVAGIWRFVGFAPTLTTDSLAPLPVPPGNVAITAQRLDSIAGYYDAGAGRVPLVGEVRRDGVVSLVAFAAEGGRFAAGRIVRDTLWIELTSFGVADTWAEGTRAAFSRTPPPPPPAPTAPLPAADSVAAPPPTALPDTAGVRAPAVRPAAPARRPAPRPAPPSPTIDPVVSPLPTPAPDTPSPLPPDTTPPA